MEATELSYAVRGHAVARYLARLGIVLAALTLPPLAVAVWSAETASALAFVLVIVVLLVIGLTVGRWPRPQRIHVNEGLVIAALAFVVAPIFMTVPLVAAGLPLIDAWFEAVSGITTTGLSTAGSVADRPASYLFTRAWMQWYGGLGIVSLSLALRMQPGAVARRLYGGADDVDLVSSTTSYSRSIIGTYAILTLLGALLLVLAGLDAWTALLHTLASVSTGGFSTSDASLAGIGGVSVSYAVTLVCFCGALPLTAYPVAVRKGWRAAVADAQLGWLCGSSAIACGLVIFLMPLTEGAPWAEALRQGPLLALSAQTTTGFSSVSVAARSDAVKLVLMAAMFIGGCAGSTAGGIKVLRFAMVVGLVRHALRRSSMPRHAVLPLRLWGVPLEDAEVHKAVVVVLIGVAGICVSWAVFLLHGLPALDSLFEVVSATATVGLSTGLSAPDLPAVLKLVLAADMLLGRVEFIALLVLFYPRTWFGKHLEVA